MKKSNARRREPEAVRDIHRIRTRILRKARHVGIANYYLGLNARPELMLPSVETNANALAESPAPYGPRADEPQAVREVREWRRKVQEEMERVGLRSYLRRLNKSAEELLSLPGNSKRTASRKSRR